MILLLLLFVFNTLCADPHVVLYFKPHNCVSERVVRELRKNIETSQARIEQDNAARQARAQPLTQEERQEAYGAAILQIFNRLSLKALEEDGCMREQLEKNNPCVKIDYDVDTNQCRALYTCSMQEIAAQQRAVAPATHEDAKRQFKAAVQ